MRCICTMLTRTRILDPAAVQPLVRFACAPPALTCVWVCKQIPLMLHHFFLHPHGFSICPLAWPSSHTACFAALCQTARRRLACSGLH